jgi:hypothetical protein
MELPNVDIGLPKNYFQRPFWLGITHLFLRAFPLTLSLFWVPLLGDMHNLTHLGIIAPCGNTEGELVSALRLIRSSFPTKLQLCLLNTGFWRESYEARSLVQGTFDERMVFCEDGLPAGRDGSIVTMPISSHFFTMWNGMFEGEKTLWELGEEVIRERRLLRAM